MAASAEISSFSDRTYEGFLSDASSIGDSLQSPGSKLSWNPGKIPTYEGVHYVLGLSYQRIARWAKACAPGYISDAANASSCAIEWADALLSNSTEASVDDIHPNLIKPEWKIRPEDEKIFEAAQRAFLEQSALYIEEGLSSHKSSHEVAAKNYKTAAAIMGCFRNLKDLEEINKLKRQGSYSKSMVGYYAQKEWFILLDECCSTLRYKEKLSDSETKLMMLFGDVITAQLPTDRSSEVLTDSYRFSPDV